MLKNLRHFAPLFALLLVLVGVQALNQRDSAELGQLDAGRLAMPLHP